jgi:cytochrome P450
MATENKNFGVQTEKTVNLLDQTVLANPYPLYHRLRSEDPVHWDDSLGGWMILRYDDVTTAVLDPKRLGSDRTTAYLQKIPEELRDHFQPFVETRSNMILFTDPPKHTRLRNMVNKAFTPRVVEGLKPTIQQTTNDLIDKALEKGEIDIIRDLAYPLPITIVGALIGVPLEDADLLRKWSNDFNRAIGGVVLPELVETAQNGILEMKDYFSGIVKNRRKNPKNDLISGLVDVEETDNNKLNEQELVATCLMLTFAGHETTTNLIGNGLHALLNNHGQMARLKRNPSLINSAVEELLRYDAPVQLTVREAKEDLKIRGRDIKKDQRVILMWGSANRDPERFQDPDKLDITRTRNQHYSFGHGIHYCLGAPLARAEGQIAINTILQRLPNIQVDTNKLEWQENFSFHGLKSLPVAFQPPIL